MPGLVDVANVVELTPANYNQSRLLSIMQLGKAFVYNDVPSLPFSVGSPPLFSDVFSNEIFLCLVAATNNADGKNLIKETSIE